MDPRARRFITVQEFLTEVPVSRTHAYELLRRGVIRSTRFGRRVLIPSDEPERLAREGTGEDRAAG